MTSPEGKIGDYTLLKTIGAGGFGEVWLARNKTGETVALKFLTLPADEKGYLDLFKREFVLLSELRHAHLARVFDFGVAHRKNQYYFTEEFCAGETFFQALKQKPFSYFEEAFVQLLATLDYVHTMGVVHFDIKGDNILVSQKNGQPFLKILDFGVAAKVKSLPELIGGTPIYMAPEVIARSRNLDHRADLYSVGMLSLYALTKKLPFGTQDMQEIIAWHRDGELPEEIWSGANVPDYWQEIVEKLLQKNPNDRFSSARVVLNFLNRTTGNKYQTAEANLQQQIPVEGPLVGREKGLAALTERIQNGSGVTIIAGEPGIGKSRLLDEARRAIELKLQKFCHIVCHPNLPFWPQIAASLGLPEPPPEPNEEWIARRRVDQLTALAKTSPLCLLIDDVQHGGTEMESLLGGIRKALQGNQAKTPLLVFAATEQPEGDIRLEKLSTTDVAQYVQLVLGEIENSRAIGEVLYRYSGGLPLLMVEGLRYLAPQIFGNKEEAAWHLPPQVGQIYQKRLELLSPAELELLQTLALLNRPATLGEVAACTGQKNESILSLIEPARKAGLLLLETRTALHHGSIHLTSQALAAALKQRLGAEAQQALHRRIAAGLERSADTPAEELAHHLVESGQTESGKKFYCLAGQRAKTKNQFGTASTHYAKALELAKPGSPEWATLCEETIRLWILSGKYRQAEAGLAKLSTQSSVATEQLRGWLAFKQRDFANAEQCYRLAEKTIPPEKYSAQIHIHNSLGNICLHTERLPEAEQHFQQALVLESKLPKPDPTAIAENSLGLVLAKQGKPDAALEFYQRRIEQLTPNQISERIYLLGSMGYVLLQNSRFAEAVETLQQAKQQAEQAGIISILFSILGNLSSALFKEGRYAQGLEVLKEMGGLQERFGSAHDLAYNLLRQGDLYMMLGMGEAAKESLGKGKKLATESQDQQLVPWFELMEAYWERIFGQMKKAMQGLESVIKKAQTLSDETLEAWGEYGLADLFAEQGDQKAGIDALKKIRKNLSDEEFQARRRLVEGKFIEFSDDPEKTPQAYFEPLEKVCLKNHFHELLWEVYHAWGRKEQGLGEAQNAQKLFGKGVELLRQISSTLPEEFRDRYLKQRERHLLFDDWETSLGRVKKRRAARRVISNPSEKQATAAVTSLLKKK